MTQTSATKCPFCGTSEPSMTCVHGEFIPECCGELPAFIEAQDPDGETGLMNACFDRASAVADWKSCVAFAAARIQSLKEAA